MTDESDAHHSAETRTAFSDFLTNRLPSYQPEPDPLDIYKYGFIATRGLRDRISSKQTELIDKLWKQRSIGGFDLLVHPEEDITSLSAGPNSLLVIGRLAFVGDSDPTARLESCLQARPLDALLAAMLDATGRFVAILSDGHEVYVFSDTFGSRSVFYLTNERSDGFSSHPGLLATYVGIEQDTDTMTYVQSEWFQKRVVKYMPGAITVYGGAIVLLLPNNYLCVGTRKQVRYYPSEPLGRVEVEEAAEAASRSIASLGKFFLERQITPVLGITGGLDTRCILAVFLKEGIKPEGMTWTGRYMHGPNEADIAKRVADVAGIPYTVVHIDPRLRHPHLFMGGVSKAVRRMVGPSRSPVGAMLTKTMRQAYSGTAQPCFLRGYGGEIIRGFYQKTPSRIQRANGEQFARAYGTLEGSPFTRAAFDHMISVGNFDERIQDYGYDINDFFYWEHRMGVWGSSMLSEMDPGMYSMVGINSRRAYDLSFGVQLEKRLSKEIMRKIIEINWPDLATVEHL